MLVRGIFGLLMVLGLATSVYADGAKVQQGSNSIDDFLAALDMAAAEATAKQVVQKAEQVFQDANLNTVASYSSREQALQQVVVEEKVAVAESKEDMFWGQTKTDNSLVAYQRYVAEYPNGKYIPQAVVALGSLNQTK